jgi:hypothetical protein
MVKQMNGRMRGNTVHNLDAGHQVDAWIKQLWNFVQTDPQYKNKTAILITTDHGRGGKKQRGVDKP